MHKSTMLLFIAAMAALLCLTALGCGGHSNTANNSAELAVIAEPNLDGFAGNSTVKFLGRHIDPDTGQEVEGYAIIQYAPGYEPTDRSIAKKPDSPPGKPPKDPDPPDNVCYEFINGLKWKKVEGWGVNLDGAPDSISDGAIDVLESCVWEWEDAAGKSILGAYSDSQYGSGPGYDYNNVVYFGDYPTDGVIAVNYLWWSSTGPPGQRQLLEWDQLYDVVDFDWSLDGAPGTMDFENIAQHELGHACGLADIYTDECSEVTMYGYAAYGETKKRSLEADDIAGIYDLYN
jgi:hypothetical protein